MKIDELGKIWFYNWMTVIEFVFMMI